MGEWEQEEQPASSQGQNANEQKGLEPWVDIGPCTFNPGWRSCPFLQPVLCPRESVSGITARQKWALIWKGLLARQNQTVFRHCTLPGEGVSWFPSRIFPMLRFQEIGRGSPVRMSWKGSLCEWSGDSVPLSVLSSCKFQITSQRFGCCFLLPSLVILLATGKLGDLKLPIVLRQIPQAKYFTWNPEHFIGLHDKIVLKGRKMNHPKYLLKN